jgi:hypothetical protein
MINKSTDLIALRNKNQATCSYDATVEIGWNGYVKSTLHEYTIVFSGKSSIRVLRLLRRGFYHCFIIKKENNCCVIVDPLSNKTEVKIIHLCNIRELKRFYREQGYTVIGIAAQICLPEMLPVRPYTCVEAVKRIGGLRLPWQLTPWQLFRWLRRVERVKALDRPHTKG